MIRKDPVAVLGPDCLQNTSPSWPCIWRIINPIRILRTFRSSLVHLAVGPLRVIGDDQSRGSDIPTGPCSQSIGNDGSFIVKSNELLAQISAIASGKRPFAGRNSKPEGVDHLGKSNLRKATRRPAVMNCRVTPNPIRPHSSLVAIEEGLFSQPIHKVGCPRSA